jgi:hypothetical protein
MIAGRQWLVYETQTPEDDVVKTLLGVNYQPVDVHGAAVEIQRVDFTDLADNVMHVTAIPLTVPEAMTLVEHLGIALRKVIECDENYAAEVKS